MSNTPESLIVAIKSFEADAQALKAKADALRGKLQLYFDKHPKVKSVEAPAIGSDTSKEDAIISYIASKVEKATIIYDLDALRENMTSELYNEITNKQYTVPNMPALIKLLKENGVKPADFKKLISSNVSLDTDALNQLYSVGDITPKMIAGCYTATITKSIQIRTKKRGVKD